MSWRNYFEAAAEVHGDGGGLGRVGVRAIDDFGSILVGFCEKIA